MTADDVAVGVLSLTGFVRWPCRERSTSSSWNVPGPSSSSLPMNWRSISRSASTRYCSATWRRSWGAPSGPGGGERRSRASAISPRWNGCLAGKGVPVIALLAEAHLETLHRLAQLPAGTRVGVASAAVETAHNLEHSIANAGLPNITLVGACPAEGAALGRLVRRVDVVVCSTSAAERVRGLADSSLQVMVDDRALDQRGVEMLAAILVRRSSNGAATAPRAARTRPRPVASGGRTRAGRATPATANDARRLIHTRGTEDEA